MNFQIQKPGRRLLIFTGFGLFVCLTIGLLSAWIAYFKTGADWWTPEDFIFGSPRAYTSEIQWLPDDPHEGVPLSPFIRQEIEDAYALAWLALNQSQKTGDTSSLKDRFTHVPLQEIQIMLRHQSGLFVEQADLSHHLQLHLFSLDKQVVSFTDHGVRVQKRISHPVTFDPLHTDQQQADFQVVMTLDDGKWRIRHFVRKPGPSASALPPVEIPDPDSALVRLEQGKFVYKNIPFQPAGVNYYPKEHPWFEFWENFDTCLLQRDLLLIRDLNLNLMRIFVPYQVFGAGEVKPQMLHRLAKVLDLAHASQIKVMVTLFDFPVGYALSDYAPTERHLKTILSQFHSHPALLAWDLKNEADLDFSPHGERRVQEWLAYMLERARVYDPHHLLTLGWAYSDHAHLFAEEVDFVSFHCYIEPGDFRYRLEELRKRVGEKPLLVSEFGMATYRSLFVRGGKTEQEQAAYYQDVLQLLAEKGNIPFIAWTLHDFGELPDEVFGSSWRAKVPQKNFGLYRKNGQAKPVCEVLQAR